jgi:hypothetical protein
MPCSLIKIYLCICTPLINRCARCNKFLNYTIEALFIKQLGTEYEFVHRLLRDHFAIRELIPILGANTELEEKIQGASHLGSE